MSMVEVISRGKELVVPKRSGGERSEPDGPAVPVLRNRYAHTRMLENLLIAFASRYTFALASLP